MTVQTFSYNKMPKLYIQEVKGTNLLSQLWYFMSFKIKKFLCFSNIIYFHFQFTSWIHIFGIFCSKALNCHSSDPARAFDLIQTLTARSKYQLSFCSFVVEDYTQKNQWNYAQQLRDWAALENPQIDPLYPHFEKTTMTTYKSKYISKLDCPSRNHAEVSATGKIRPNQ